ncbi:MAG: LPS assembly lipoprotein LptE [Acidobacteriota bacterium]
MPALLPALLLGLVAVGCGYALVGRGSNIPESVEAVYLEALVNRTQRSQVDQFLTRAIADELTTRRLFDLLGGPEGADAVLKGSVENFAVTPITFDNQGLAREYEISITAKMSFVEIGTDEVIWSNDRYLFRENYVVEEVGTNYLDRENDAIERAAENFAETMVSDLLEGF